MGAANAQRTADAVISKDYSFCIISGFAGALNASVNLGDVGRRQKSAAHGNGDTEVCARNLWTHAFEDGAKPIESLLTTDHVVDTATEKTRLAPFADAVDMETFCDSVMARTKEVPAIVIRIISDSFDRDMPVDIDTMVDEQGHVRLGGVVRYVAKHPLMVPALVRLGRDSKTAAEALAHFLEAYINKLSFATHGWPPPELQEVAAS